MSWLAAFAGLVSGPRMLKMVRTPSSLRMAATFFMALWCAGAYIKPMLMRSTHSETCSGVRSSRAPSVSSTSALPEEDEALRPPCLATLTPAAATTNMLAVEILKVLDASPPVPHISSNWSGLGMGTLRQNSRMTEAARSEEHTSELQSRGHLV